MLVFSVIGFWSLVSKQDIQSQQHYDSTGIIRRHEDEENEDIIQTSPVEKDEGILQHKSQPRLKRLERTVTGDRTSQEGTSGETFLFPLMLLSFSSSILPYLPPLPVPFSYKSRRIDCKFESQIL